VLLGSRDGQRMGDWKMVDTMIVDGLWDVYNQYHMGITAENVAKQYGITREAQDALALASQQKAAAAQEAGRFKDEIVPCQHRPEEGRPDRVRTDEFINRKTSAEALAGLRPPSTRPAASPPATPRAERRRRRRGGDDGRQGRRPGPDAAGRIASYASAGLDPAR
jgi:acetyl-CoA C-acetyltransferase